MQDDLRAYSDRVAAASRARTGAHRNYAARLAAVSRVLQDLFYNQPTLPRDQVITALRNRSEEIPWALTAHGLPAPITIKARNRLRIASYHLPQEPRGPFRAYSTPRGLQVWSVQKTAEVLRAHRERLDLS